MGRVAHRLTGDPLKQEALGWNFKLTMASRADPPPYRLHQNL